MIMSTHWAPYQKILDENLWQKLSFVNYKSPVLISANDNIFLGKFVDIVVLLIDAIVSYFIIILRSSLDLKTVTLGHFHITSFLGLVIQNMYFVVVNCSHIYSIFVRVTEVVCDQIIFFTMVLFSIWRLLQIFSLKEK